MYRKLERDQKEKREFAEKGAPLIKFVSMGAKQVGKTALVCRFTQGSFSPSYKPTVEDCYFRNFYNRYTGTFSNIRIIDTSGQYDFPAMQRLNMSQADVLLLVYEVGNVDTMRRVMDLYRTAMEVLEGLPPVPVVFVGAKIDKVKDTGHYETEIEKFIKEEVNGYGRHLLTSAKLDMNVDDVFETGLLLLENVRVWARLFTQS